MSGHKNFVFANVGKNARKASKEALLLSTHKKNDVLSALSNRLKDNSDFIISENVKDVELSREKGLSDAMIDRLYLDYSRIERMCEGIEKVIDLPDLVGEITDMRMMPSGIQVGKMRVPLGVIGVVYESRPNVTSDVSALCLKSGNAVILRGGRESIATNLAIAASIQRALIESGVSPYIVQMIPVADRRIVQEMKSHPEWVDLIVPRGGKSLIEAVCMNSKVPVLKHLDGICHTYVDQYCDIQQSKQVVINAKTRRYGVCNATETLLIHQKVSKVTLETLVPELLQKGVELYGCQKTLNFFPSLNLATEQDWVTEYLAPKLSIRIVESLDEAILHIQRYGSGHTDAILSKDLESVNRFVRQVDSGSVMVNCSTQFADGFEYGLGAEMGISTDKVHARGPIGLEGLTSQKYIVYGQNSTRS